MFYCVVLYVLDIIGRENCINPSSYIQHDDGESQIIDSSSINKSN